MSLGAQLSSIPSLPLLQTAFWKDPSTLSMFDQNSALTILPTDLLPDWNWPHVTSTLSHPGRGEWVVGTGRSYDAYVPLQILGFRT